MKYIIAYSIFMLLCSFAVALLTGFKTTLTGIVVWVQDGDSIIVKEHNGTSHKVRLAEIDAPELGQKYGDKARMALMKKLTGKHVTLKILDADKYGRLVCKVTLRDRDINREMVKEGHAFVYRQYLRDYTLLIDESEAKHNQLGIWAQSNKGMKYPWVFRQQQLSQ